MSEFDSSTNNEAAHEEVQLGIFGGGVSQPPEGSGVYRFPDAIVLKVVGLDQEQSDEDRTIDVSKIRRSLGM